MIVKNFAGKNNNNVLYATLVKRSPDSVQEDSCPDNHKIFYYIYLHQLIQEEDMNIQETEFFHIPPYYNIGSKQCYNNLSLSGGFVCALAG